MFSSDKLIILQLPVESRHLFEMRHSVENYIIFILLFSVNCIILYPKYFSYGENGIFVEQSLYITYTQTYL